MKITDLSKLASADILKNSIENRHKCTTIRPEEIEQYISHIDIIPKVKVNNLINTYGPQGQKGSYTGIHFDSFAEYTFYRYNKDIKGLVVERNTDDFFIYTDETGKSRKFYYDFRVSGISYEVKGILRPTDQCKMSQCPQVTFVFMDEISPMAKELDKTFSNWRDEYQKDLPH